MKNAGSRRHFFLVWLFAHRGVDGYAVHAFKRLQFEHCGVDGYAVHAFNRLQHGR